LNIGNAFADILERDHSKKQCSKFLYATLLDSLHKPDQNILLNILFYISKVNYLETNNA